MFALISADQGPVKDVDAIHAAKKRAAARWESWVANLKAGLPI